MKKKNRTTQLSQTLKFEINRCNLYRPDNGIGRWKNDFLTKFNQLSGVSFRLFIRRMEQQRKKNHSSDLKEPLKSEKNKKKKTQSDSQGKMSSNQFHNICSIGRKKKILLRKHFFYFFSI